MDRQTSRSAENYPRQSHVFGKWNNNPPRWIIQWGWNKDHPSEPPSRPTDGSQSNQALQANQQGNKILVFNMQSLFVEILLVIRWGDEKYIIEKRNLSNRELLLVLI